MFQRKEDDETGPVKRREVRHEEEGEEAAAARGGARGRGMNYRGRRGGARRGGAERGNYRRIVVPLFVGTAAKRAIWPENVPKEKILQHD